MRARQTLDPIAKAKKPPRVVLEREIYGGAQRALWEQLWNLPESAKSVLLIGHNPALQDLALELAHADLNKLPASAGGKFPTGAMASFRFDGAWKALEPHGAVLIAGGFTADALAALAEPPAPELDIEAAKRAKKTLAQRLRRAAAKAAVQWRGEPAISRSNWAKESSMLSVNRPMEVVVLNCCVTEANDALWASKMSTISAKSESEAVFRPASGP